MRLHISVDDFTALTKPLLGLPLSLIWRGHGTTIFLEFGALKQDAEADHPRGELSVMLQWGWRVESRHEIAYGFDSDETTIAEMLPALAQKTVQGLSVVGRLPELAITLSDATWLTSFMPSAGQPGWTVFLPDGSWLHVDDGQLRQ